MTRWTSLTLPPDLVSNMHGTSLCLSSSQLVSLNTPSVGCRGRIGWLSRHLHSHPQYHRHRTKPSDLQECDVPSHCVERRRSRRKWCLLPVWMGPTGASVDNCLRSCDEHVSRMATCSARISESNRKMAQVPTRLPYVLAIDSLARFLDFEKCRWRQHCIHH
jgi:hypothetical protein